MKFKAPIEVESSLIDSSNSPGSAGQVLTSTGTGVDWIAPTLLPAESAEKVIQTVRMGEAVSKGDPLIITGYHGSNGPAIVERADATDDTTMPAYGVALEDYANNATGLMIAVGDFNDFDTSSYNVGDTLYVAVGGGMTNVKPTGTALIQNMGIVSRKNANNGDVEIVAIGRTNDVPNLPEGRLFVGTSGNTSLTSDVVYIDDTNDRVGIGTATPLAKTHIKASNSGGDSAASGTLIVEQGSSPSIQLLSANSQTQTIKFADPQSSQIGRISYSHPSDAMFFVTNDSEKMRITSAGNIGIGTTSPGTVLPSGFAANTNSKLIQVSATSGNYDAGLLLRRTDNATGLDLWTDNTTGDSYIDNRYNNTNGDIRFRVKTSGTPVDAVIIAGSGNVGIGTTSPSDKLHVSGGAIRLNNFYQLRWGGTGTGIYGHSSQGLNFYTTSGTTRLKIDNSGNVGIGTTAPLCKLNIVGQAQVLGNGFYGLLNINGSNALADYNTANKIVMNSNGSTDALYTGGLHLTRRAFTQQGDYGSGIRGLSEGTVLQNNALELYTSTNTQKNTTRLKITAGGNVGIGTTSPVSKLDIISAGLSTMLRLSNTEANATTKYGAILGRHYTNAEENVTGMLITSSSSSTGGRVSIGGGISASNAVNNILFYTAANNTTLTGSERMRIDSSGNVGIGVTNPSAKLHIKNGSSGQAYTLLSGALIDVNGTSNSYSALRVGSSAGNNHLVVTNAGNVGVGATSPGSKLEIAGDTSNALLTLKSNNGGSNDAFMRFYDENTGPSYSMGLDSSDEKFKIAFDTDGDSLTTGTKLVMDTSGNVGIGTTSPSAKLHITTTQYNTGCRIDGPAGTLSYGYMSFYSGTSYRGAISTTSTGVNYASASDYRLKENVTKLQNSTEKIKKLKPSNFNFLENPSETVDGFIAHELQEIVPEAVTGEKDAVGLDGKPSYQGVDQSKIVPLLTAALQEAISKIEQLETRIQTLENKKNGNNL